MNSEETSKWPSAYIAIPVLDCSVMRALPLKAFVLHDSIAINCRFSQNLNISLYSINSSHVANEFCLD